jgi:hypothetical protein
MGAWRARSLGFGNLRPVLGSNSEETEFFRIMNHTRGGKSIGLLIDLYDNNHRNIGHRAKLARAHKESVENSQLCGMLNI